MVTPVNWRLHGTVTLCDKGWPLFPMMPKTPGLYRLTLKDGRCYIGEAGDLQRRLKEYRRPTRGIEQEHRIYAALIASGGGTIEIFTDGSLTTKAARSKLEKAAILAALASGIPLLNNDGADDAGRIEARISFLEAELAVARARLAAAKK